MKNNRLTNREIYAIKEATKEIKRLVTMETCVFKDEQTVNMDQLKIWLQWFKVYVNQIDKIVDNNH